MLAQLWTWLVVNVIQRRYPQAIFSGQHLCPSDFQRAQFRRRHRILLGPFPGLQATGQQRENWFCWNSAKRRRGRFLRKLTQIRQDIMESFQRSVPSSFWTLWSNQVARRQGYMELSTGTGWTSIWFHRTYNPSLQTSPRHWWVYFELCHSQWATSCCENSFLQADVKTLDELINAARVADAAVSTSDPALSSLLEEVRASNAQHAKHNAAFQELSSRLDKLQVTLVQSESNYKRRQVHFDDQPPRSRSPSPSRYPRQFQQCSINYSQGQRTWTGNEGMNAPNNFAPRQQCYRCGKQHFGSCPAQHAACLLCSKIGHFHVVCLSGRRTNNAK